MIGFTSGARSVYHKAVKVSNRFRLSSECRRVYIDYTFSDDQEEELTQFAWSRWSMSLKRCERCSWRISWGMYE